VDVDGKPLPYANVVLQWTVIGAMTDAQGRYSLLAPVGPHQVRAMMMGHVYVGRDIVLEQGDSVVVDFVLEKDPAFDPSSIINFQPDRLGTSTHVYEDPWPYEASLEPVRWGPLQFELRYVLTDQADSVLVNLVAEARNVAAAPFTVCGHFSYWSAYYNVSSEVFYEIAKLGGKVDYDGPVLDVSADNTAMVHLICDETTIPPGGTIARGMSFAFSSKTFEYWTGEVSVQCYFFAGKNGARWSEGWRVYLGQITVPIRPIGQPLRH